MSRPTGNWSKISNPGVRPRRDRSGACPFSVDPSGTVVRTTSMSLSRGTDLPGPVYNGPALEFGGRCTLTEGEDFKVGPGLQTRWVGRGWVVTEWEWLTCQDPRPMLEFLRDRSGDRKLWLLGAACCRRVWDLLTDERSRRAVEVVERFVDGEATEEDLSAASDGAGKAAREVRTSVMATIEGADRTGTATSLPLKAGLWAARATFEATLPLRSEHVLWVSLQVRRARAFVLGLDYRHNIKGAIRQATTEEFSTQADLLRDIFGSLPFRAVTVDPSWLDWNGGTVVQLARSIYDDRKFEDLPILADALEEAGCTDPDILDHCRSGGDHVRGCWVVDLLLGKG